MGRALNNLCCQAGIIDEMMEDMLEAEEDEEIEQEADAEVDKILFDLTNGKLGQAGTVGTELPVRCLPFGLFLLTFIFVVRTRPVGRRGDGAGDGKVPPAVERYTQFIALHP